MALLVCLAMLAAGCGEQSGETPVACLEAPVVYFNAVAEAPGKARLNGEVPISDCLPENQAGGDLAHVGYTMLDVATMLNAGARGKPGGEANLQIGYLIGAAERGAEGTEGIHDELIRRLTAAARFSPGNRPLPATFLATYKRGFDAGHAGG